MGMMDDNAKSAVTDISISQCAKIVAVIQEKLLTQFVKRNLEFVNVKSTLKEQTVKDVHLDFMTTQYVMHVTVHLEAPFHRIVMLTVDNAHVVQITMALNANAVNLAIMVIHNVHHVNVIIKDLVLLTAILKMVNAGVRILMLVNTVIVVNLVSMDFQIVNNVIVIQLELKRNLVATLVIAAPTIMDNVCANAM